ncbi:MAG: arylsulfatase A-like enzyme [Planctomycetota bacterium]|jgi:arylsulfatase A-like enzyme
MPLLLICLALLLTACGGKTASANQPKLVVLAVIDTLSAVHVSHLGYPRNTSPNLDALAAEGVTFEQAITTASYTVASIPSILTGRYPDRHGLSWYDRELPSDEDTLAELFANAGYESFAAVMVANGGVVRGALQGFDDYLEMWVGKGPEGSVEFEVDGDTVHIPEVQNMIPLVRDQLASIEGDEKLFLYLHILEPHGPYTPPKEYLERFVDEYCPQPVREDQDFKTLRSQVLRKGKKGPAIPLFVRTYDAFIAWADHNFGLILDEIKLQGLYEEALIIVTSDHGEIFMSHGQIGHGKQLYDEVMRVPLIIKLPSSYGVSNLRLPQLVSNIDVVPTICDLIGMPRGAKQLDSYSLAPLIRGTSDSIGREDVFMRARTDASLYGMRTSTHKAILHVPPPEEGNPLTSKIEIYALASDPQEQRDLAAKQPEMAERLRRKILGQLAEFGGAISEGSADLGEADLQLLEALGYTGAEVEDE